MVVIALASCSSNTTIIVASPTADPATPASSSSPPTATAVGLPDTHAIDAACATLSVHLHILAQQLRGMSPITDTVVEEFAFAAKQLDKAVPALQGTVAGSDLADLANEARSVGDYQGTNIGHLLDLVTAFANDAKSFNQTHCQIS